MSIKNVVTGTLLFVAGAGAGYGVGYILLKKKFQEIADREIEDFREQYQPFRKEGVFATPGDAVRALIPTADPVVEELDSDADRAQSFIDGLNYDTAIPAGERVPETGGSEETTRSDAEETGDDGLVVDGDKLATGEISLEKHNLFDDALRSQGEPQADDDELTDNMPDRDPDNPYLITVLQFMHDGEHEDSKISLIYFEGDDVLITEDDERQIDNVETVVGLSNLHEFGRGSDDPNALYVRNEKLEADYEIIRDHRTFQEVILGVKEPKVKTRPLRMRDDDE